MKLYEDQRGTRGLEAMCHTPMPCGQSAMDNGLLSASLAKGFRAADSESCVFSIFGSFFVFV